MKAVFFLDLDTQKDLMLSSGALSVPGAERMIPKLRRLFDFAQKHEISIVSSLDTHAPEDPEFGTLPPHCIAGTDGQRKIEETLLRRPLILGDKPFSRNLIEAVHKNRQIIVAKHTLDPFSNPETERLLRALPLHAIVFGVPLDLTVRLACLGLRRLGIKTALVSDAVRALHPHAGDSTIEELKRSGVESISLEMILGLQ